MPTYAWHRPVSSTKFAAPAPACVLATTVLLYWRALVARYVRVCRPAWPRDVADPRCWRDSVHFSRGRRQSMTKHLPVPSRWMVVALALGLVPAIASAQTTISGHVATDANLPLEGVSVSIPALSVGAYTNAQGNYSFTAPARARGQAVTITARHIGYAAKSATVTLSGGSITQDFALSAAPTQLTGIIVTALGIEREKSRLGTAVQAISNDELTTTKSLNIVEQLQGKVSGVQITSAGTQGGSTNIVIRGQNSITGNNQPLFIVDGVPVSNQARGGSVNGAYDFGSALSDLNPDDTENISVLKGPTASSLYGSRAANGVVLITTKKGRNTGGRARTDATTTFTMDRPSRLWDYQNLYGQ